MKKWNLPFRISLLNKIHSAAILPLLFNLACTINEDSLHNKPKSVEIFNSKEADVECLNYKSVLQTATGDYPIRLRFDIERSKTIIQIEDRVIEFDEKLNPTQVCLKNVQIQATLKNMLERSIPGCQIKTNEVDFTCEIPSRTVEENMKQLKNIKHHLLRQTKRVPYLLSRRLNLAENLGDILEDKQVWDKGLDSFCAVSIASLPVEQPLILVSPQWKEALCKEGVRSPQRFNVGMIVLTKAVDEIDFLYSLQDEVNISGQLAVHLHKEVLPASRRVWVKLEPAQATMNYVLSVARTFDRSGHEDSRRNRKKLKKFDTKNFAQDTIRLDYREKACWFPGFPMKDPSFGPGVEMRLFGSGGSCKEEMSKDEILSVPRYFIESISGETSFELADSNVKILSLPAGAYHYSIYEYPDKLGVKLEKNLVDQGILVWNGSRHGLNIARMH